MLDPASVVTTGATSAIAPPWLVIWAPFCTMMPVPLEAPVKPKLVEAPSRKPPGLASVARSTAAVVTSRPPVLIRALAPITTPFAL